MFKTSKRGSMLAPALIVMCVVLLMGAALITTGLWNVRGTVQAGDASQAYYAAKSVVDAITNEIVDGDTGTTEIQKALESRLRTLASTKTPFNLDVNVNTTAAGLSNEGEDAACTYVCQVSQVGNIDGTFDDGIQTINIAVQCTYADGDEAAQTRTVARQIEIERRPGTAQNGIGFFAGAVANGSVGAEHIYLGDDSTVYGNTYIIANKIAHINVNHESDGLLTIIDGSIYMRTNNGGSGGRGNIVVRNLRTLNSEGSQANKTVMYSCENTSLLDSSGKRTLSKLRLFDVYCYASTGKETVMDLNNNKNNWPILYKGTEFWASSNSEFWNWKTYNDNVDFKTKADFDELWSKNVPTYNTSTFTDGFTSALEDAAANEVETLADPITANGVINNETAMSGNALSIDTGGGNVTVYITTRLANDIQNISVYGGGTANIVYDGSMPIKFVGNFATADGTKANIIWNGVWTKATESTAPVLQFGDTSQKVSVAANVISLDGRVDFTKCTLRGTVYVDEVNVVNSTIDTIPDEGLSASLWSITDVINFPDEAKEMLGLNSDTTITFANPESNENGKYVSATIAS